MIHARPVSPFPITPLGAVILCVGGWLAVPASAWAQSDQSGATGQAHHPVAFVQIGGAVKDPAWTAVVDHGRTVPLETASLSGKTHARDGIASYYWQGQMTASGEAFNKRAMTAAHKTLPFGSMVKVTNLNNGRTAVVRINDRGPFKPGRVIDVSEAAAEALDMKGRGLAPVRVDPL
jgi:rare lipoprotein A